jgi:hypothetical protein
MKTSETPKLYGAACADRGLIFSLYCRCGSVSGEWFRLDWRRSNGGARLKCVLQEAKRTWLAAPRDVDPSNAEESSMSLTGESALTTVQISKLR